MDLKVLNAYDVSTINAKIYLHYKLAELGVDFDDYRQGRHQQKIDEIMRTSSSIAGVKVDISASDFHHFALGMLVDYASNRNLRCSGDLAYYHATDRETQAFQDFVHKDLDIILLSMPHTCYTDRLRELYLGYREILRRRNEYLW